MATALNSTLFDAMLDAAGSTAVSLSLHTAQPDATGSAEVSGGSYARQTVTWDPASGGLITVSGDVTWDVPGDTTITWCGFWDGSATWLGAVELSTAEPFAAPGQYVATVVSLTQANLAA